MGGTYMYMSFPQTYPKYLAFGIYMHFADNKIIFSSSKTTGEKAKQQENHSNNVLR